MVDHFDVLIFLLNPIGLQRSRRKSIPAMHDKNCMISVFCFLHLGDRKNGCCGLYKTLLLVGDELVLCCPYNSRVDTKLFMSWKFCCSVFCVRGSICTGY